MNCLNCFTCQKGVAPGAAAKVPVQGGANESGMTYFIFTTNECNLRCSYCYATKTPRHMDEKTAAATIAFVAAQERAHNRPVSFQFFGGEPTSRWNELVRFIRDARAVLGAMGKRPRFGMTTNATLLDEERMITLRQNDVTVLFSIDGRPETHDRHRRLADGSGSARLIRMDLIQRYFPNAEIRPTIMPDTVATWMDDLRWFYAQEFFTVATEVCYEAEWTAETLDAARRTYEAMAEEYVRRKRARLPVWMKFIEDARSFIGQSDGRWGDVCGTAKQTLAIDADGGVFACQRYASYSDPALRIGDVGRGVDPARLAAVQALRREWMTPPPRPGLLCDECVARHRCRGNCNASNFQLCGDRRTIHESYCVFLKMWAKIAFWALAATGELWPHGGGGPAHGVHGGGVRTMSGPTRSADHDDHNHNR